MEVPTNVFNYQHQLCLTPESSTKLGQRVERFVIKERKLWLGLHEELTEQVFLDVLSLLVALIKGSPIEYLW